MLLLSLAYTNRLRETSSIYPVILSAALSQPQCCLVTEEHGPLVLKGKRSSDGSIFPDVRTLAVISTRTTTDKEWNEVLLLQKQSSEEPLVNVAQRIAGLERRLEEAANKANTKNNIPTTQKPNHPLEEFLARSEAVMKEFQIAVKQFSKRKRRKRSDTVEKEKSTTTKPTWTVEYAEILMNELTNLENTFDISSQDDDGNDVEVIKELSDDLVRLTLQYRDEGKRIHELQLKLCPQSFPLQCPDIITDLPSLWEPPWKSPDHFNTTFSQLKKRRRIEFFTTTETKKTTSKQADGDDGVGLVGLYEEFCRVVNKYQDFWNELDDLDRNTWILEPSNIPCRRSLCDRRIAINESVSLVLTLDPYRPRNQPSEVRFVGSDVSDLHEQYQEYSRTTMTTTILTSAARNCVNNDDLTRWSEDMSVRKNLERCLGIVLPGPDNNDSAANEMSGNATECGICYAYELPIEQQDDCSSMAPSSPSATQLPEVICDNPPCARNYHASCLHEWLQSLPTARISFDLMLGTCPYCCEPISAPIFR